MENEIINYSSLKNLMAIGGRRLEEMLKSGEGGLGAGNKAEKEIEEDELKAELDSMHKEIDKLSESERLLEAERKKFQAVFDIESLFYILSESIKSSSGIYIKN